MHAARVYFLIKLKACFCFPVKFAKLLRAPFFLRTLPVAATVTEHKIKPFNVWWPLKGHTYLRKPIAKSGRFVYVCIALLVEAKC